MTSYGLVKLGGDIKREDATGISDVPDVDVEDHAVVRAYTCAERNARTSVLPEEQWA